MGLFLGRLFPRGDGRQPVPPLAGYNKDRGGCDIKVRYQRVTDAGSANGRYPELAGEWRPTRQGQWTRPHQARDRRTVERWDADSLSVPDRARYRRRRRRFQDGRRIPLPRRVRGARATDHAHQRRWHTLVGPRRVGRGTLAEGDRAGGTRGGCGGSLRKVEVGRVMSWYDYRARGSKRAGACPRPRS